ncbi:MAG: radical SAM protein, partial [Alphaproteobacteria bacterium]
DARIGPELRRWMGSLPCQLTFVMGERHVRVVHGGVREINAFFFASTPREAMEVEFSAADADTIIGGHCGLPFTRCFGAYVWHNSGALGLPANDGTPRVWYSLLVPEDRGVRFEHHALDYDHRSAHAKMVRAGLPGGYAEALMNGLWPNLDILPPPERRATGTPLRPAAVTADILAATA